MRIYLDKTWSGKRGLENRIWNLLPMNWLVVWLKIGPSLFCSEEISRWRYFSGRAEETQGMGIEAKRPVRGGVWPSSRHE